MLFFGSLNAILLFTGFYSWVNRILFFSQPNTYARYALDTLLAHIMIDCDVERIAVLEVKLRHLAEKFGRSDAWLAQWHTVTIGNADSDRVRYGSL